MKRTINPEEKLTLEEIKRIRAENLEWEEEQEIYKYKKYIADEIASGGEIFDIDFLNKKQCDILVEYIKENFYLTPTIRTKNMGYIYQIIIKTSGVY
jgi:hypothetical protein